MNRKSNSKHELKDRVAYGPAGRTQTRGGLRTNEGGNADQYNKYC